MCERIPWRNPSAEDFLVNRRFWNYVGELEPSRGPWEFDPQKPEESLQALGELRNIALLLVNELDFLSPPSLWSGRTPRRCWGKRLMEGDFTAWKKVQRRSGQFHAAIFYPSSKRNYDFMLCVNKYSPVALTQIQDANVRANKNKLEPICKSFGLQFGHTTETPILLPQEPKSCSLDAVRAFVEQLERLRTQIGCSIRELGRFLDFG